MVFAYDPIVGKYIATAWGIIIVVRATRTTRIAARQQERVEQVRHRASGTIGTTFSLAPPEQCDRAREGGEELKPSAPLAPLEPLPFVPLRLCRRKEKWNRVMYRASGARGTSGTRKWNGRSEWNEWNRRISAPPPPPAHADTFK